MINDVILTGHFRVEFNTGCYIAFERGTSVRTGWVSSLLPSPLDQATRPLLRSIAQAFILSGVVATPMTFTFFLPRLHCQCDTFFKRDCTLPLNCMVQYLVPSESNASYFMGIRHTRPILSTCLTSCYVMKVIPTVLYFSPTFDVYSGLGIANLYGLDGPGFKPRLGQEIFSFQHPFRPAFEPTQTPVRWVQGSLPEFKWFGRCCDHPLHLAPRKWMGGVIPLLL
jgi:hypothetical protein